MLNKTIHKLPILFCHFIDLPDNRLDCSKEDPTYCVTCAGASLFLAGGSLADNHWTPGHIVSLLIWLLTVIMGLIAVANNILILIVLKKHKQPSSLHASLMGLASFDLLASLTAIVASTGTIVTIENWNHGSFALHLVYLGTYTFLFAKSGSSWITLLITLERILAIALPHKSVHWVTREKVKIRIGIVVLFALSLALPRFLSVYVTSNPHPKDVFSLQSWPYTMEPTSMEHFWYRQMKGYFNAVDYWIPLPLLLIGNLIIYWKILEFAKKRETLSVGHRKEINAAKILIPVVATLFFCNIGSFLHYFTMKRWELMYREGFLAQFLSMTVNSAVNLPIYYWKLSSFRKAFINYFSGNRDRSISVSMSNDVLRSQAKQTSTL